MRKSIQFISRGVVLLFLLLLCVSGYSAVHSADVSQNGRVSLGELLRVIQFYNSDGYSCDASGEDGYRPGAEGTKGCKAHDTDYLSQDWSIELSELLRLIQLYNTGRYMTDAKSEDGYAGCTDAVLDPHIIPVLGDADGNYLTEAEEEALGISGDTGEIPIGIRLAQAAATAIDALKLYNYDPGSQPPEDSPYLSIEGEADCFCLDPFTEEVIYFDTYELVDPVNDRRVFVTAVARTFLSFGSFSYLGEGCQAIDEDNCYWDGEQHRLDVVTILSILGIDPATV